MSTPNRWLATTNQNRNGSPDYERVAVGAKDVLVMLADAECERVKRVTGNSTDRSPLRIYIEDPTLLIADAEHGPLICGLATQLARWGLRSEVRVEVQW
jgi:hypothetical protein